MKSKKAQRKAIYWCLIIILNITVILFMVTDIMKINNWDLSDTAAGLFLFSIALGAMSLLLLVNHIKKVFDWVYDKILIPIAANSSPAPIIDDVGIASKEVTYKAMKYTTLSVSLINIIILLVIYLIS